MSISDTYNEVILEKILRELLQNGTTPTITAIENAYNSYLSDNDLTNCLFDSIDYSVAKYQASSASTYNAANNLIQQDLYVLFRHLLKITDQSINNFNRWKLESEALERRLDNLNDRISTLVLINNDSAGYLNYLQDTFIDTSKVDLTNTDALIDIKRGIVTIGTNNVGATRIDLSHLKDKHVEFAILNKIGLVNTVSAERSKTSYAVSDIDNFWQERIYTNKPVTMSVELKINLLEQKEISRIDIDLHMANKNGAVQITPLYSTDNYNWSQFPITNPSISILDKYTLKFEIITAQYIKFIFTKPFDVVVGDLYCYEFGVNEISFYSEGFEQDTTSTLITKSLSISDEKGSTEQFSKVVLEVCEDVPTGTTIDYSIAVSNDDFATTPTYIAIDPINRTDTTTNPTILDFGDLEQVEFTNVGISYDPLGTTFVNPGENYRLVISSSNGVVTSGVATASSQRYVFLNSNDRLLDYVLDTDIDFTKNSFKLWRNVRIKESEAKVRNYLNGWSYVDPYYKTTVLIKNPLGYTINFGGKAAIVDDEVVQGVYTLSYGTHIIKIHKENWKYIDRSTISDLITLKAADSLYPYNHRYLIEGFLYPSSYPLTNEKIYLGCDIVAEYLMKEVSIFDLVNNVKKDNYSLFAFDYDLEDTSRLLDGIATGFTDPNKVIVLKIDENNSDFINEKFVIQYNSINQLFTQLKLKVELSTTNTTIAPILDAYRIKLNN